MTTAVVLEQIALDIDDVLERARTTEKLGVEHLWLVQLPNQRDTMTVAGALAAVTETATVGTGIVPAYSRLPVPLAQAAHTLDEISGHRFSLGVGLGHRNVGEWMVGAPAGPPLASMRDYLTVLTTYLRTGEVDHTGTWFSGHATYAPSFRSDLPVLLGSFGPRMLQLAGEFADGAILWMCGVDYVEREVLPNLRLGRARRGLDLDGFEIVYMLPSAVSSGGADGVAEICRYLAAYLRVPTYRRLFAASGFEDCVASGRPSTALAEAVGAGGDEAAVRRRIARLHDSGVTQVAVSPVMGAHLDGARFLETVAAAV